MEHKLTPEEFSRIQAEWYEYFYKIKNYPHNVADTLSWSLTYVGYTIAEDGMVNPDLLIRQVLNHADTREHVRGVLADYSEFDGHIYTADLEAAA